jgi:hypothetical protein
MKLVGKEPRAHLCALPRRGPLWNRNPLWKPGNIIQCEVCEKKYVLTYWPYAEIWDWEETE